MKILFVNHYTVGTSLFYRDVGLGKALIKRGHEVTLLIRSKLPSKQMNLQELVNKEVVGSIKVVYWKEPFELLFPFNILQLLKCAIKADVIHLERTNPFSSTSALIAKILFRKPLFVDFTDWDGIGGWASMTSQKRLISKLAITLFEEIIPRKSDAVIVVSKTLFNRVAAMGVPRDQIFYIPNNVDTEIFNSNVDGKAARNRLKLSSEPVIVYLGVLYKHDIAIWKALIMIMKHVVEELPNARLMIIGWGPAMRDIKEMAEKLNIQKNILPIGGVPHRKLPEYLAAADVALTFMPDKFPYYLSCSPKALFEYMAAGKAIVGSDIGEIREALKDDAGLLINSEDPKDYAEAILRILADPALQNSLSENAKKKAYELYSNDALVGKLEKAYEKGYRIR